MGKISTKADNLKGGVKYYNNENSHIEIYEEAMSSMEIALLVDWKCLQSRVESIVRVPKRDGCVSFYDTFRRVACLLPAMFAWK